MYYYGENVYSINTSFIWGRLLSKKQELQVIDISGEMVV